MKKIINFAKDCYAEMKKVVWPSRESVIASTKVVVVSVAIFAVVLGVIDFVFAQGLNLLY